MRKLIAKHRANCYANGQFCQTIMCQNRYKGGTDDEKRHRKASHSKAKKFRNKHPKNGTVPEKNGTYVHLSLR
jgi:hypothetical protein